MCEKHFFSIFAGQTRATSTTTIRCSKHVMYVRIAYSYICFSQVFLIERTEVRIGWEIRIILKPCDLVSGLQIVRYGGKKRQRWQIENISRKVRQWIMTWLTYFHCYANEKNNETNRATAKDTKPPSHTRNKLENKLLRTHFMVINYIYKLLFCNYIYCAAIYCR